MQVVDILLPNLQLFAFWGYHILLIQGIYSPVRIQIFKDPAFYADH